MWSGGRHFSRARETVARSTNTERTRCSDQLLFDAATMLVGADLYPVQPSHPEPAAATPGIR
jgi:hypothetical protein